MEDTKIKRKSAAPPPPVVPRTWKPLNSSVLPQGPVCHTVVKLDLQVMLRIANHCMEDTTATVTGELIGLEVGKGQVEVTNCFVVPSKRDTWLFRDRQDIKELEDKQKKESEKYRTKMRELLHYVDADCQSLGWFQTMPCSGFFEPTQIEDLFQRINLVERSSIILALDLSRESIGRFPFRAFQLSQEYFQLRKKQENNEITGQQLARALGGKDVLVELPVQVKSCAATDALLYVMKETDDVKANRDAQIYNTIATNREDRLLGLASALNELTYEGERLTKFQRESSKFHQAGRRNFERKKVETESRKIGEEGPALDEEDQTQTNFYGYDRRVETPNYLKALLIRRLVA